MEQQHIAILDFGSQYMHLISRRIRQLGVLSKIYPTDVSAEELRGKVYGIVLSGGPNSVNEQHLPYDPAIFDLPVPILGLCYGHQLMAHHYGGVVTEGHDSEYGLARIAIAKHDSLFKGLGDTENVWMSHWDSVTTVPDGFEIIASSEDAAVSGMANVDAQRYGLQFHVEVHHTTNGLDMLRNFVLDICNAKQEWSMDAYLQTLRERIKTEVGERNVFLLVSGGVDSSVAYALLEDILGKERVYGLHVDNGMMRRNESMHVKESLAQAGFDNLHVIDAGDRFLNALEGKTEPEEKRGIIGSIFLDVQRDVFADLNFEPEEWMLGQGTIYPDTIESGGTDASQTIKTHHNRVPEIMEMIERGQIIEPLAELYKDEVRALGAELGLPESLLNRWPFPGPGLGIRTLCSDGVMDEQYDPEFINSEIQRVTADSPYSGVVMPVQSVGVQGDQRSYQHPAVITGAAPDWEALNTLAVDTANGIASVNRVLYHVAGEVDFSAMTLRRAYMTERRLDLLRAADHVMNQVVQEHGLYDAIWQFPVVLIPIGFGPEGSESESLVLRPIESQEAMTVNFYQMDPQILTALAERLLAIDGIDAVFYDITNKPPATIEWE